MGLERTRAICHDARGRFISKLWKKIFSRSSGGSDSSLQLCQDRGRDAIFIDVVAAAIVESEADEDETCNDVDPSSDGPKFGEGRSIHTPLVQSCFAGYRFSPVFK